MPDEQCLSSETSSSELDTAITITKTGKSHHFNITHFGSKEKVDSTILYGGKIVGSDFTSDRRPSPLGIPPPVTVRVLPYLSVLELRNKCAIPFAKTYAFLDS